MNINYIHINWNKLKNKDKNNYFINLFILDFINIK